MFERNKNLLLILGVLLVVRFLFVPWYSYQSALADDLQMLTSQVARSRGLMGVQQELKITLDESLRVEAERLNLFPVTANESDYKRDVQRAISDEAAQLGVKIDRFDWLDDDISEQSSTTLKRHRSRMTLSGGLRDLALLQATLESKMPWFYVAELSYSLSRPIATPSRFPSTMTVEGDFYFREDN